MKLKIGWPALYNSKHINHAIFKLRDEGIDVTIYQRFRKDHKLELTLSKQDALAFTLRYGLEYGLWVDYGMEQYINKK